jgi:hypothetical protein
MTRQACWVGPWAAEELDAIQRAGQLGCFCLTERLAGVNSGLVVGRCLTLLFICPKCRCQILGLSAYVACRGRMLTRTQVALKIPTKYPPQKCSKMLKKSQILEVTLTFPAYAQMLAPT